MDKETYITHLEGQINLTRIIEIKPYSSLLVVCVVNDLDSLTAGATDAIFTQVSLALAKLFEGQQVALVITGVNLDLDFYRIDPNG